MKSMYSSILKVVIFGDAGCGKTTLAKRFMSNIYIPDSTMTIGVDSQYKTLKIDGRHVKLMIWDFAGEERFRFTFPHYIAGAKGGILMYDITDHSSFLHVANWLSVVNGSKNAFPILLLGGKSDLKYMRKVSLDEAKETAKKMKLNLCNECSSKTGENVESVFKSLTKLMLNRI
jgi:small GTP-binding protein